MKYPNYIAFFLIAAAFLCFFASDANAQRRDYMTDAEIEIVRDAQEIDLRVGVLTRMIDRRFAVLENQPSPIKKNAETWGAEPKGTRLEMLSDISKLLTKAIEDIDQVVERQAVDAKMFPKAVNGLVAACGGYTTKLKMQFDNAADEKEKGVILGALESCAQVTEAAAKLPEIVPKEEKKKKSN